MSLSGGDRDRSLQIPRWLLFIAQSTRWGRANQRGYLEDDSCTPPLGNSSGHASEENLSSLGKEGLVGTVLVPINQIEKASGLRRGESLTPTKPQFRPTYQVINARPESVKMYPRNLTVS